MVHQIRMGNSQMPPKASSGDTEKFNAELKMAEEKSGNSIIFLSNDPYIAEGDKTTRDTTTLAMGEEGGGVDNSRVTTLAVGEEGGECCGPGHVTTMALGEEGGGVDNSRVTTLAVGEEGGGECCSPGHVTTTLAMGEEGGGVDNSCVTTLAVGEEGGGDDNTRITTPLNGDAPGEVISTGEEGSDNFTLLGGVTAKGSRWS